MSTDPDQRRDTPLARKLKERIRRDGPITLVAYMIACLEDPEYGYYVKRAAVGRDGDFITAPEINQAFGELIGLWCAVVWQQMGAPKHINLVELGPGRGTLIRDALRAARLAFGFLDVIELHLVESSEPLRILQKETLQGIDVRTHWHTTPATVPSGAAIVIANEFLDALPIEQIVFHDGKWRWRQVGLSETGDFSFTAGGTSMLVPPADLAREAEDGAVFEHADAVYDLLDAVRARGAGAPMAMLAIDYGHTESALGDTLQGIKRHTHVSPFETPGETDLTTQVDFQQVAAAAAHFGLAVDGPVTQAEFLGRLGIVERASRLMAANPNKAAGIEEGVARLMAPNGMGTRFKAIGIRSAGLPVLPGFA